MEKLIIPDKEPFSELNLFESLKPLERIIYKEVENRGLPSDYLSLWTGPLWLNAHNLKFLQPIPTLAEHVGKAPWSMDLKKFVLERGNKAKIEQINNLAAKFNQSIDGIRKVKDTAALKDFYTRAMEIYKN